MYSSSTFTFQVKKHNETTQLHVKTKARYTLHMFSGLHIIFITGNQLGFWVFAFSHHFATKISNKNDVKMQKPEKKDS